MHKSISSFRQVFNCAIAITTSVLPRAIGYD